MNHRPITIILTGGGSGGHITPLLPVARELKRQLPDCKIVYVGFKGDNFDSLNIDSSCFDFRVFINAGKFRRYHGQSKLIRLLDVKTFLLNVRDFFRLLGSLGTALRIIGKFKPDAVFSKGGFVVVPVGMAAKLRGVPIVTHDSDAVPGLANRIVGRWARIHATGMPAEFYSYKPATIRYVGVPINPQIRKVTPKIQKEYRNRLGLPDEANVMLLSGGGNGSRRLNNLLLGAAPELLAKDLSMRIIHICGWLHEADVKASYKDKLTGEQLKRVSVMGFTPEFYAYSAAADVIVARAGATTIAELSAAGKACVIIPSPFLAGGHQLKNAEQLAAADAAVILDEQVDADEFLAVVNELFTSDSRRFELSRNIFALAKPQAAAELAEMIIKTAKK
jgi:UDP-N-acetylglucosamine--N-acetylmuramyl-(pentapeptide) pyrophosphoryl-undecaprenol N-acetylglucosamine transferase